MSEKKYYWLKLKKDFFKRHDIRIIEGMPDGIQISHFYLKLMLESVDHDGELRFSEDIPYTPDMLAIITDTDKDIVVKALEVLTAFKLLVIDEDQTIKLPKVSNMVGYETEWAKKKREYREKQEQEEDTEETEEGQSEDNVQTMSDKSKRKSKSIEKDIFLEKNAFVPPTIEEVVDYCYEIRSPVNPQLFYDYYTAKNWCIGNSTHPMTDWKAAIHAWENNQKIDDFQIPWI